MMQMRWPEKGAFSMNSGDGRVKQNHGPFPFLFLFLESIAHFHSKTATRIRQKNHYEIPKKKQKAEPVCGGDAWVSSRHPWMPKPGFPT